MQQIIICGVKRELTGPSKFSEYKLPLSDVFLNFIEII